VATTTATSLTRRGLLGSCLFSLATAVAGIAATGATSSQAFGTTGSWSQAAPLITGRGEHTATLLRDGNVLIVGGTNGRNTVLASDEISHPATGRLTPAQSLIHN
jgi:hypothetical protein